MIVIVILGVLSAAVTINVRSYLFKAKQNTAKSDIAKIVLVLDTFFGEYGRYPNSEDGLEVLSKPSAKFPEPLLERIPIDPWGRPYQYISSGPRDCEVFSFGPDGQEGGVGVDADISSKNLGGEDQP